MVNSPASLENGCSYQTPSSSPPSALRKGENRFVSLGKGDGAPSAAGGLRGMTTSSLISPFYAWSCENIQKVGTRSRASAVGKQAGRGGPRPYPSSLQSLNTIFPHLPSQEGELMPNSHLQVESGTNKPTIAVESSGALSFPHITLQPQKQLLSNGLTVITTENLASPTITIKASVKAGSVHDRDLDSGLACIVGRMLERGTKNKSLSQVAEGFDFLGAQLKIDTDFLTTTFTVRGLSKDVGSLIQQLGEILQSPAFPAAEFEKARTEVLAGLREESDDTRKRAEWALRERIYPAQHPFSRNPRGTIKTIEKLRLSDLLTFYKKFYRPDQLVLAVAGAAQADQVFQLVESSFERWTVPGTSDPFSVPKATPGLGSGQQVVRMSDKPRCDLTLGFPAVSIRDPEYYPMLIITQILGVSGSDGRLGGRLRGQEGLASYAGVSMDASLSEGPLIVHATSTADHVDQVVKEIQEELAKIRSQGITIQELAAAKQRLINLHLVQLESNEGITRQMLQVELLGLGDDYFNRFPILIGGITMDQITDYLRTCFSFDQPAVVIAGPYPPK